MSKLLITLLVLLINTTVLAQTTIIKNIQGYTLENNKLRQFSAIEFSNDKISKLYNSDENIAAEAEVIIIDGHGQTLLPGLIDAHGHVLSYGQSLQFADLVNSQSEQEAVVRTVKYAKDNTGLSWVQGRGWNQVQWPTNQFPSAQTLDSYFPNTPVWLRRVDGHAGWANSKAMALAGIDKTTISPNGGEIIRNELGQPTGVFIDNAMDLISKHIPELTKQQQKSALIKSMKSLASMGLTSVHDAGINEQNINLYKELTNAGKMPIRINAMLYLPSENWQSVLKSGTYKSRDDMFALNSVKIQADGALGSRGAALIEDYSDHAGHKGLLLHDEKSLKNYVELAMTSGFQVNTHAIGDNANKIVLDLYQETINSTKSKALRHRVEHAQILRLVDIPRFAKLGVIASMQATHATSDKNMAIDRVGEQRILGAYAWRKLLNAEATIAAGSDFPVESPNPFYGLFSSVTRQDHANQPKGGWLANEKMTRIEAFRSFTIDAAYSGHQEGIIGSLEIGKKADFILLSDNFFTMPASKIWQSSVNETWVNGKKVYHK